MLQSLIAAIVLFFVSIFGGHQLQLPENVQSQLVAAASALVSNGNPFDSPTTTPSQASEPSGTQASTTVNYITEPVIERVVESDPLATDNFVTQDELNSQLLQLSNSLTQQLGASATTNVPQNVAADGNAVNPYAAENAINNLSNVSITNPTFVGVTTSYIPEGANLYYTDARVESVLAATTTLATTFSANVWSALNVFSGGASSTNFSNFGTAYFGGTATTTIDSSGNLTVAGSLIANGNVTLGNATATNFFATTASSTNLLAQTASLGSLTLGAALGVTNGGTGLNTAPSYGQILVGNSSGGYTLTATSSLGIGIVVSLTTANNLQTAINNYPAGTIFELAAGTWHQQTIVPKYGDEFIGDPGGGTILTGDDTTIAIYVGSTPLDVLFKNITVEHYHTSVSECNLGAIHGADDWTFINDTFTLNNCVGLNLGQNSEVIGGHYTYNAHAGIESGNTGPMTIEGAEIAYNNTRGDDINNDAAGIKFGNGNNAQISDNWIHDNYATGIWMDVDSSNIVIDNNTVVNNLGSGIVYEVSTGGTITNNVVNNNGTTTDGTQIAIDSSGTTTVATNNVSVSNGSMFAILLQATNRGDAQDLQDDVIRNNAVTFTSTSTNFVGGTGFRDYDGLVATGTNEFANNVYYVASAKDPHWYWYPTVADSLLSWAAYQASGEDATSKVIVGNGSISGCQQTNCPDSGAGSVSGNAPQSIFGGNLYDGGAFNGASSLNITTSDPWGPDVLLDASSTGAGGGIWDISAAGSANASNGPAGSFSISNFGSLTTPFLITSGGHVGIGTTTPVSALDVEGGALTVGSPNTAVLNLTSYGTGSAFSGSIQNATYFGGLSLITPSGVGANSPILFFPGGSEAMGIQDNGNVGIGTTTPNDKLDVVGSVGSGAPVSAQVTNTNSAGYAQVQTNNNNGAYSDLVTYGGAFGTGDYLGLNNSTQIFSQNNLYISTNEDVNHGGAGDIIFTNGGYDPARTEHARLTAAGNFGIGTSTPATALDVLSTNSGGQLQLNYDSTHYANLSVDSGGNFSLIPKGQGNIYIGNSSNPAALNFYQESNGTPGDIASFRADFNNLYLTNPNGNVVLEDAIDQGHALRIQGPSPFDSTYFWYDGVGGTNTGTHFASSAGSNAAGSFTFALSDSGGLSSFNVQNNLSQTLLTAKSSGNVGIGTTTPYSRLTIWGPDTASTSAFIVANSGSTTEFTVRDNGNATLAGSLIQNSDERLKTNIQSLDASDTLAFIDELNPITFNWVDPNQGSGTQIGFIAQQVLPIFPNLVSTTSATALTPDGTLSVNYIGFIAPIISAIQALDQQLTNLANTVAGFAESFTTNQLTFNRAAGGDLSVTTLEATTTTTQELCVGQTCVTPAQFQAMVAAAGQSNGPASGTGAASTAGATDTPPIIQINGDDPAITQVGDTYNDLGATITGPQADLNLGIETYLNGALTSNIVIDTSAAATDTIDYVATDQSGLAATSTRTVIIKPAGQETASDGQTATSSPIATSTAQ